jgi:predicted TIM-barrel fold metal-dependent hydrolase
VLKTFPGVFSGIGEFTIHKEFVSSKVSGQTASLTNPALDRILDFAAEAGLVALIHNDADVPFPKEGAEPAYLTQMKALLKRHPNAPIIWAHCGLGRIIVPIRGHIAMLESILIDPAMRNVYFDISWEVVAKYIVASPETVRITADLINRNPDRFLFGTDEVAPSSQEKYTKVYYQYDPLWKALTPEASEKVRKGNYERLFDAARHNVRAWEAAHLKEREPNAAYDAVP